MGEVWKARDTRLNRHVAIKKSQARFSERFALEAQAIAALNHPHICQIYDVGSDYLVMAYVEGKPLTGPLPVAEALHYASQITDALDAAHRKGITHRDLKPGNILVGKAGVEILDQRRTHYGGRREAGTREPNITLGIYSHALPADNQAAAKLGNEAMADAIAENRKSRRLSQVITGSSKSKVITLKSA